MATRAPAVTATVRSGLRREWFVELCFGPPEERVAAAWRIGEKRGLRARPLIEHRLEADPHPGVRQHLVVMLAGFGAVDELGTIARQDRHASVRATAVVQIARLMSLSSPEGTIPSSRPYSSVLMAALDDPSPLVRAQVLRKLPVDAPDHLWAQAFEHFADPHPTVRRAIATRVREKSNGAEVTRRAHQALAKETDRTVRSELKRQLLVDERRRAFRPSATRYYPLIPIDLKA